MAAAATIPLVNGNPTVAPPNNPQHGWFTVMDHATGEMTNTPQQQILRGTIQYRQLWTKEHPTVNNREYGKFRASFWQGTTQVYPVGVSVGFCAPGTGNLPVRWFYKSGQIDFPGAGPPPNRVQWIFLEAPRVYVLGTNTDSKGSENRTDILEFSVRFPINPPLPAKPAKPVDITMRLDHWGRPDHPLMG